MTWIIFLLIGFAAGYVLGLRQAQVKVGSDPRKEKVLALFDGRQEITNDDVEKAFGVSDATATRYLDELEKQGIIVQVGKEGRFVKYRRR